MTTTQDIKDQLQTRLYEMRGARQREFFHDPTPSEADVVTEFVCAFLANIQNRLDRLEHPKNEDGCDGTYDCSCFSCEEAR